MNGLERKPGRLIAGYYVEQDRDYFVLHCCSPHTCLCRRPQAMKYANSSSRSMNMSHPSIVFVCRLAAQNIITQKKKRVQAELGAFAWRLLAHPPGTHLLHRRLPGQTVCYNYSSWFCFFRIFFFGRVHTARQQQRSPLLHPDPRSL